MVSITEIAELNLALQVFLVLLLASSYMIKRRGRFVAHGRMMLIGIILNGISFLLVMGPSLFGRLVGSDAFIVNYPLSKLSLALTAHATFGTVAEILGGWIVASWRLGSNVQKCARNKKAMRATFIFWLVALFLGILIYFYQYL